MGAFRRSSQSRLDVALLTAIWLLLQTVAGFASGASASPIALDAFGNPLCITSQEHGGGEAPGLPHNKVPACCTLSCGWSAATAVPVPNDPALEAPLTIAVYRAVYIETVDAGRMLRRLPANPRGPPSIE